ncbi:hypothetical protein V2J09_015491 [Rumex salicifolius]
MSGGEEDEGTTVEFTPTWVVALYLKKRRQIPLYEALQKIKGELMLLGFISLLLTVTQNKIGRLCISSHLAHTWLPCYQNDATSSTTTTTHFQIINKITRRRFLSEDSASDFCEQKGKVPLLSVTAVHHLHIFIFVLAVVHVTTCALTVLFGGLKIRQWKLWEDAIQNRDHDPESDTRNRLIHVHQHSFIKNRFLGIECALFGWIHAFFKQFYGSVTKTDYITMRTGFITTHCKTNPKFNFHKYMERAFEADFKKVVGIRWYLWLFVIVFLLLNIAGYHAYFWIAFIPLVLLLGVGTKLQHVITQLAEEVASRHVAVVGDIEIKLSDGHFWFHKPRIILLLIHITLFQNSFEIAYFFWIWVQYGFNSCIMGPIGYNVPRIIIALFVQFICSYSTLPLYAIVTQMGSNFNKAIFEDHIQEGLVDWANQAKKNVKFKHASLNLVQKQHREEGDEIRPAAAELRRVTTF